MQSSRWGLHVVISVLSLCVYSRLEVKLDIFNLNFGSNPFTTQPSHNPSHQTTDHLEKTTSWGVPTHISKAWCCSTWNQGYQKRWPQNHSWQCFSPQHQGLLNLPLDVWGTGSAKARPWHSSFRPRRSVGFGDKDSKKRHRFTHLKIGDLKIPLLLQDSILDTFQMWKLWSFCDRLNNLSGHWVTKPQLQTLQ